MNLHDAKKLLGHMSLNTTQEHYRLRPEEAIPHTL